MLKLSLVVPDATVNYIENPNCRYDTTGYNAVGATLTRSLDYARFGIASCKVVTGGTLLREGVYYRVNALASLGGPVTVSVYVLGTGIVRCRLIDNPTGKEWSSQNATLRADRFVRLNISGVITGSNDVRLYVETNEGGAKARTFYVGGLQMERKAYMTTFCDGDQPGCRWNGLYHSSTSERSGETRAGGRWVVIGGPEREEQDLYMTVVGGLGMAGIKNNTQSYALDAGGYFQNKKITERVTTLTFHAKHKVDEREDAVSLAALHQLRQLLIDVVKPDRTGGDEDILFEYDDGELPLYLKARYDGGLEGDWDIRNQWVNSFPLRLLAVSPLLYEDQQVVMQLDFQESLSINYAVARIKGVWNQINYGMDDVVNHLEFGKKGELYATGVFSKSNNNALATDPLITTNGVAYWDGKKWNSLSTGMGGSHLLTSVAVAPNGNVYVGGTFTTIGGVAANRIAYWDGNAWNALGTGLNDTCTGIAIAPNGDVYCGGLFTTAGGVACFRIARWDGLTWRRVGQYGGLNDGVGSIVISSDGQLLYAGGVFSDENGNPGSNLLRVARYNISTGLFSAMGDGFNSNVSALRLDKNGMLYAVGNMTLSGSTVVNKIAVWNGTAWRGLGNGMGTTTGYSVSDLSIGADGRLYVSGYFTTADGQPAQSVAVWNGSSWAGLDIRFTGSHNAPAIRVHPQTGDVFVGTDASAVVQVSGITIVNNPGSTEVRPIIYIIGQGSLRWIENQSLNKRLYLNLDILANEEVFFDFAKGTIKSTVRGDLFYALLPGSDFRSFVLRPGENQLACLMYNDVNAKMQIAFTPQHWSADATQNVEAL